MTKENKPKTPKMNKRVKAKWIEALRSGKYKQVRGSLRETEYNSKTEKERVKGYCCLGVLCDIFKDSTVGRRVKAAWGEDFLGSTAYLPEEVRDWAGLPGEDIEVFRAGKDHCLEGVQEALTTLNDTDRAGFKRIATWVENNL